MTTQSDQIFLVKGVAPERSVATPSGHRRIRSSAAITSSIPANRLLRPR
jgi:hypothetical protein